MTTFYHDLKRKQSSIVDPSAIETGKVVYLDCRTPIVPFDVREDSDYTGDDWKALTDSIKRRGVQEPIHVFNPSDKVLDALFGNSERGLRVRDFVGADGINYKRTDFESALIVLSGHRRLRALAEAADSVKRISATVPALVVESPAPRDLLGKVIAFNVGRREMSAYAQLDALNMAVDIVGVEDVKNGWVGSILGIKTAAAGRMVAIYAMQWMGGCEPIIDLLLSGSITRESASAVRKAVEEYGAEAVLATLRSCIDTGIGSKSKKVNAALKALAQPEPGDEGADPDGDGAGDGESKTKAPREPVPESHRALRTAVMQTFGIGIKPTEGKCTATVEGLTLRDAYAERWVRMLAYSIDEPAIKLIDDLAVYVVGAEPMGVDDMIGVWNDMHDDDRDSVTRGAWQDHMDAEAEKEEKAVRNAAKGKAGSGGSGRS